MSSNSTQYSVEREFVSPVVVMSACLELEACRHDGHRISNSFIARLLDFVELEPICPEVEIGLGVPRDSVRLVGKDDAIRLVQPSTDRDLTDKMHRFSEEFLGGLDGVDAFILKAGSPTCGANGSTVYSSADQGAAPRGKQPGGFAGHVLERFGDLAVETEGRLRNYPIRHHFLTRAYVFAELRQECASPETANLGEFHRRHKHLLMTYDQDKMRRLGRIAAEAHQREPDEACREYAELFRSALAEQPDRGSYINSLTHMYGHFKDRLGSSETDEFMSMLEEFRDHQLPLHALLTVVRSWCTRFEYEYFADQSLLEPYPRELIQMRDSGKGIDF